MGDRYGCNQRIDRRGGDAARNASASQSCRPDVVPAPEWQEFERLESPVEPIRGARTPEALKYLLEDDPEQENVLVALEERSQPLHGWVVCGPPFAQGE